MPLAKPVITSPVKITPTKATYSIGETLTAEFTITNRGAASITFDEISPGAPWTEVEDHGSLFYFDAQTSNAGIIELMVEPGTYDIRVKGTTTLKNLVTGVVANAPGPVEVDIGTLIEGDVNGDNMVTGLDYSAVIMCFGYEVSNPSSPEPTPMCDFNNDGYATGLDYSAVIMNFGLGGADIE